VAESTSFDELFGQLGVSDAKLKKRMNFLMNLKTNYANTIDIEIPILMILFLS